MVAVSQYAFHLDARACSGCKACQVACKDKHHLPVGASWRRVYEVTGGGWMASGKAWVSNVFAYNLSVACNQCETPICVEVCPARAIAKRDDGVVTIDSGRCIGCKYCAWACPYDAPQYNAAAGYMGKCTFCADELDAGKLPTCVAACPLRVLEFGKLEDLQARYGDTRLGYPFAEANLTSPAMLVTPHAAAPRRPARIGNLSEVGRAPHPEEQALVAFTLLAQTAVGAFWGARILDTAGWRISLLPVVVLGIMFIALLASLLHLGKPLRAWRAVTNLGSSWLSREILLAVLFTGGTFAGLLWGLPPAAAWATALLGAGLVYAMARVYQVRTIPAWNTWWTLGRFTLAALLLGGGVDGLAWVTNNTGNAILALALATAFVLILASQVRDRIRFYEARLARRTA